jgi:hypothetical protein
MAEVFIRKGKPLLKLNEITTRVSKNLALTNECFLGEKLVVVVVLRFVPRQMKLMLFVAKVPHYSIAVFETF